MPCLANVGNNLLPTYIDVNFVIYEMSNISLENTRNSVLEFVVLYLNETSFGNSVMVADGLIICASTNTMKGEIFTTKAP